MLIKRAVLDRIVAGEIDLVFRRWKRPTVKSGGSLRTAVGMLDIVSVEETVRSRVTAADAARAGFSSRAVLLGALDSRSEGSIHRVEVRPGGADPRIALREDADLSAGDIADVVARLDRLDAASRRGPWTREALVLLAEHPHVRAEDLASRLGLEKPVVKADVSKLKTLGLTISHSPGYELSPRGQALLRALRAAGPT